MGGRLCNSQQYQLLDVAFGLDSLILLIINDDGDACLLLLIKLLEDVIKGYN